MIRNIAIVFLLSSAMDMGNWPMQNQQEKFFPKVKLHLSKNENLTWGDYVQYSIDVSDKEDGESKYGEILNDRILLEIEFMPFKNEKELNQNGGTDQNEPNHQGLSLMMESNCFACHADKAVMTGPSFTEIASRYEKNPNNLSLMAHHILEGSSGQWRTMEMPAHPNLTLEESENIAVFILTQGNRKNHQILTGLEGMFQIMEKPDDIEQGVYTFKASYTSTSLEKGQQRIVLPIK